MRQYYRRLRLEMEMLRRSRISFEDAQRTIENLRYQSYPIFTQSNIINKHYDLMIVIPVYNAAQYIEVCLQSVLSQKTKYTLAVVAVDDGSKDTSGEILDRYDHLPFFTVIHQENRGHSGARNRALETITGRYVMFLDADDYLADNAVEALLDTAFQHEADMVVGGYAQFSEIGVTETVAYGDMPQKVSAAMLPGYTCMKVFRAELLEHFCFPRDMLFEDTVLPRLVFPCCQTTYTIPQVIYYYRTHKGSFSASHHRQATCLDTYWITKYCLEESMKRGYERNTSVYEQYLQQCRVNYLRTQYLSPEIQEAMFVLTAELLMAHFKGVPCKGKYNLLHRAFKRKSFLAYRFLMQRWEVLS